MSDTKKKYITRAFASVAIILFFAFAIIGAYNTKPKDPSAPTAGTSSQSTTTVKEEKTTEAIPYSTRTVEDSTLEYGKTAKKSTGKNGVKTYTYQVTYEAGKETNRKLINTEITTEPIDEVIAKGTAILWHCVDATSYNKNPYDDNKCTSSTGEVRYVSDSQAVALDSDYVPGKSGHPYYNSK